MVHTLLNKIFVALCGWNSSWNQLAHHHSQHHHHHHYRAILLWSSIKWLSLRATDCSWNPWSISSSSHKPSAAHFLWSTRTKIQRDPKERAAWDSITNPQISISRGHSLPITRADRMMGRINKLEEIICSIHGFKLALVCLPRQLLIIISIALCNGAKNKQNRNLYHHI